MDGTMGGYHAAINRSSTKWVIDLQGGGECASQAGCDSHRGTQFSSSKYFKKCIDLAHFCTDDDTNPKLRYFNRVFLPYCSQDLWTGTRTTNGKDTFGYYFAGHNILAAVLDELDSAGLTDATDIILTGESAGGIGVWPNVDWIAERYPRARVVAAPIAGFYFFAYPYDGPQHTSSGLVDFREAAWPSHYNLWGSFVDKSCAAAIEPWRCVLANNSFPYIQSEAFIVEAQTDKVVLLYHDWIPNQDPNWSKDVQRYFESWHYNMTIALAPSMNVNSKNGVFNPACFIHTKFSASGPFLDGKNYLQAFQEWFFGEGEVKIKLQDSCGILCNPSCAH